MVSSRGIPTNHTVDGGSATLRNFINRTPTSKADGSFLNIIHILLYCRLDPFLIPARLRAIALQKNRREIASASTPNLETNTFSVSISCRNRIEYNDVCKSEKEIDKPLGAPVK